MTDFATRAKGMDKIMRKIPHIIILVFFLFFCVSFRSEKIYKTNIGGTETVNQTSLVRNSSIDEIFSISLPDDLGFSPYVSPDMAEKHGFEHGEYVLMVRASKHNFTAEMIPIFSYAFLGEEAESFEYGNKIYNDLVSIYSKQYPYVELPESYFDDEDDGQEEALRDYFFKKNIIFISSDATKVLCQSHLFGGLLSYTDAGGRTLERKAWNKLIEIYDEKECIYERLYKDNNLNSATPYIYDFFINHSVFDMNGYIIDDNIIIDYIKQEEKNIKEDDIIVLNIPNATNKFLTESISGNKIYIHSLLDGERLVTIKIPNNAKIYQFTKDEKIVVSFQLSIPSGGDDLEEFYTQENIYSNNTYLMNLDGSNVQYLGDYMFNPHISPDGKYIAYTGLSGTDHQEYSNEYNRLEEMSDGFYIKNIETNKTIFYPVEDTYEYKIVGWVNKKGLEKLRN